jgi:23S rRNA pseudouridine955/2504/2580 synthase
MFLHARRLRFEHPATGEVIELEAPVPAEFDRLTTALQPLRARGQPD